MQDRLALTPSKRGVTSDDENRGPCHSQRPRSQDRGLFRDASSVCFGSAGVRPHSLLHGRVVPVLGVCSPLGHSVSAPGAAHPAWDFPLRSRPSSIVGRRHVTRRYSITATRLGLAMGGLTQLWLKHDAQSDAHFTHSSPGHSPSLTTVRSSGADPSPCAGRGRSAIIAFPRAPSLLERREKGKPVRMTDSDCRKS